MVSSYPSVKRNLRRGKREKMLPISLNLVIFN